MREFGVPCYVGHFQPLVFVQISGQYAVRIVFRTVVYNNDFEIGIVLFQHCRKEISEVFLLVPCTYYNRHRLSFSMGFGASEPGRCEVVIYVVESLYQEGYAEENQQSQE